MGCFFFEVRESTVFQPECNRLAFRARLGSATLPRFIWIQHKPAYNHIMKSIILIAIVAVGTLSLGACKHKCCPKKACVSHCK